MTRVQGILCVLALALASAACLRLLAAAMSAARVRAVFECARAVDDIPRPPGFIKSALLTSCAIVIVATPLLGGAIADRNWRHGLLLQNARELREASVQMNVAAPGMGARLRVIAEADGVLIRNICIQELIALAYGVSHFAVHSNQMFNSGPDSAVRSWLITPRYDVRIDAPIRAPAEFDAYALRQRVTRLLAERFGLEIEVNGTCQSPCGRWDKSHDLRPL